MTQIPVSSIHGGSNSPANVSSAPQTRSPVELTRAPELRSFPLDNIRARTDRMSHWHQVDGLQKDFQNLDSLAKAINGYRSSLGTITRLLTSNAGSEKLDRAVAQLQDQINGSGHLDLNLRSEKVGGDALYRPNGVNFLSTEATDETLAIGLPSREQTSFRLSADASITENLERLQYALTNMPVTATLQEGVPVFSGPEELMGSPWIFQGEDVRVPRAGVRASMQEMSLTETLRLQVAAGNYEGGKSSVRTLYKNLATETQRVEGSKAQLYQQMSELGLNRPTQPSDIDQALEAVISHFTKPTFDERMQAYRAQANLSRDRVLSTLKR